MTQSIDIPYERLVRQADPDWQKDKMKELEYEFDDKKKFYADPTSRGIYGDLRDFDLLD